MTGALTPDLGQQPEKQIELRHAAIIIPVFRHSVFVGDAINSAMMQKHVAKISVVVVDDGCPHVETQRVLQSFALAYPENVHVLRRTNGGLSAARNSGIDYALSRWPDVEAIYLLDADNEIEPDALKRAWTHICQHATAGWAYPDIAMRGSSFEYWDYGGPYSVLRHLVCNVSDTGSLIKRSVFEAGCRFDENMKAGFEDWEFWWQAISKGFCGVHVPFMGLRYRKRPESMLSEAEERRQAITRYMRDKHSGLLSPRNVLQIELRECPRYALIGDHVQIHGDVRDEQTIAVPLDDFANDLAAAVSIPALHRQPGFLIFGRPEVFQALRRLRLDRSVAFWLEQKLRIDGAQSFAALTVIASADEHLGWRESAIQVQREGAEKLHLVAITVRQAARFAAPAFVDRSIERSGASFNGQGSLLELSVPNAVLADFGAGDSRPMLEEFSGKLQRVFDGQPPAGLNPKPNSNPDFLSLQHNVYEQLDMAAPMPSRAGEKIAVFALPLVSFGGVETTALRIAQSFKKAGWSCRLLVMAQTALIKAEWREAFDDIFFFWNEDLYRWDSGDSFLGSSFPQWKNAGAAALEGFVSAADVLLNFHCAALHKLNSNLRRKGVTIVASLHVNDQTSHGRLTGHPHIAIGYEHAIDFFACCSTQMSEFCHALGVPADKIIAVPNAPGQRVDLPRAQIGLLQKLQMQADQPLQILFLGRLDRQKGLSRLSRLVAVLKDKDVNVLWRFAGGAVMGDEGTELPAGIREFLEPPAQTGEQVAALYDWADILILPSLWEGLPLTLLESAPYGVVPIVADTGAVREAVEDAQNGFVIASQSDEQFVSQAAEKIEMLAHDRQELHRMSIAASGRPVRSWDESCKALLEALNARVARNRASFSDLA